MGRDDACDSCAGRLPKRGAAISACGCGSMCYMATLTVRWDGAGNFDVRDLRRLATDLDRATLMAYRYQFPADATASRFVPRPEVIVLRRGSVEIGLEEAAFGAGALVLARLKRWLTVSGAVEEDAERVADILRGFGDGAETLAGAMRDLIWTIERLRHGYGEVGHVPDDDLPELEEPETPEDFA